MSYFQLLGMQREPFSTSPDPSFYFQSERHRSIMANLLIEFQLRRGLSVLHGEIGTGKTTLGRALIQQLRDRPGFCFHMMLDPSYPSEEDFFRAVAGTLRIDVKAARPTLQDYREALQRFLFEKVIEQKQVVVLIIDEAHKLSRQSLEMLRVLLNYETNDAKLLQLLLIGQPELLDLLNSMPNLIDRVSYRARLQSLSLEETGALLRHRLECAGYSAGDALFSDGAVEAIYEHSKGYPRRIGMLAHKCVRLAVAEELGYIAEDVVFRVLKEEFEGEWNAIKSWQKSVCSA